MFRIIQNYRKLENHILCLVAAELFIQLINTAFFLILLIYMQKVGYTDYQSADFISYRFLGTLLLAFPLGLFLKSRKIKPIFLFGSYTIPIFALFIIYAIENHIYWLLYLSNILWGISFLCFQVTALPYILRNSKREMHTEAISLSFATFSIAGISSGIIIFLLKSINPELFVEKTILQVISCLSFLSIFFIARIKIIEEIPIKTEKRFDLRNFDWRLIFKALAPTLIISTGAGLTIPFIGIFFYNIHHVDSHEFALYGSASAVLVAIGAILVPKIKRSLGYRVAVPVTQSIAVIALALLASTEWFKEASFAVDIALICYLIRQPMMNIPGPMVSEISMNYVGRRNREIVSGLTSAIWSGSWFISSRIFKELREEGFAYVNVFLITAGLYALGVIWYYILILDYNKREKLGLIEN